MDIVQIAKLRKTAKVYDASKKISKEDIEKIKELLRLGASSTNLQGWHFFVVSSDEARAKVIKSVEHDYPFNLKAMQDASHIVVFCSKSDIDDAYFAKVLEKEDQDGRFLAEDNKKAMDGGRKMFTNLHKEKLGDLPIWLQKQVYINLGSFLLGIEALGIHGTAMEGFNSEVLDKELGLAESGLESCVVVPIGYRDEEADYNYKLPKSRLDDSVSEI